MLNLNQIMKKILFLLAATAIVSCSTNQNSSNANDSVTTDSTKTTTTTTTTEVKKAEVDSSLMWKYETDTDKMTSKLQYFAAINSTNTLNFAAPYDGGSTAKITVRNQARKNEVILTIDKGQFICAVSEGCAIKIRFDNDPAITVRGNEPSDYSSTTLFIDPASKIIMHAKKAKKMIIQAEFYQEGLQNMEFNIDGFKWDH